MFLGGVVLGINDALVTCDSNDDEVDDVSEVSTATSVKSVSDSRDFELSSHLSQSASDPDEYWDIESDDDSFMPRKPVSKIENKNTRVIVEIPDWSGLDDESTVALECSVTSETATMTSYLPGEADNDYPSL